MKKAIDDELRSANFRTQDLIAMERIVAAEKRKLRDDVIEECARVAELVQAYGFERGERIDIAAAIRAKKDKPDV